MLTNDARRITDLQRQVDEERRRRIELERKLAGTRSALLRFQAEALKRKAAEVEARTNPRAA